MIQISSNQTKTEFSKAALGIFMSHWFGRVFLYGAVAFFVIACLGFLATIFTGRWGDILNLFVPMLVCSSIPAIIYWSAGRTYEQKQEIIMNSLYTFDDEGFSLSAPGVDAKISWRQLHDVRIVRDSLVLFHQKYLGEPIPLRSFSDGETEQVIIWFNSVKVAAN